MAELIPSRIPADWPLQAQQYDFEAVLQEKPLHTDARVAPRWPLTIDWHAGFEMGVILSGEQRRLFTDGSCTLHAGDVWLDAMWEPHGWSNLAPATKRVVCNFLPEFLGDEMLGDRLWMDAFTVPPGQRPASSMKRRGRGSL